MASIYEPFLGKYVRVFFSGKGGLIGKLLEETDERLILKPSAQLFTWEELGILGIKEAEDRIEHILKHNTEAIVDKSKVDYLRDACELDIDYEKIDYHIKEINK